jgi:glycerol-3-phosphate dehydrogenase
MAARRRAREGLGHVRPSLRGITRQPFDVTVIGGGINGTEVAAEAARRGYRTLLIERHDFAAGTTSRATRLIHGGLRYLEHGEFGLVYESLGERETIVRDAPHLVRPLRLLVPVYRDDHRPPWMVRAGLLMYDALSFRKSLPRHRAMPPAALATYEPGLSREGLRAAYTFYDAQVEFPERLVIESLRAFIDAGGVAMNHASCERIVSPGGVLRGLAVRDDMSGESAEVATRVAVNAAGPWVDQVLAGSDAERHERLIGGTRGSHLVAAWPDGPRHAVFATAKADGRPFFILPWYGCTLVGTTDLRYDGDPSAARCTPDELRYLLDEANRLFPSTPLARDNVLYTYSGIRPLPYTERGDESTISRSHFIIDHMKRGGPSGLLSIVGGKLTTYRSLARLAMPAIAKHVSPSGDLTPGLRPPPPHGVDRRFNRTAAAAAPGDPLALYGSRRGEVQAMIDAEPALGERVCEHNPELLAQVAYAVEYERGVTLADVLLRRIPAGWSKCHALDGAERVARVMAQRLGWDDARVTCDVAAYKRELRETLVPVDAIVGET